MANRIVERFANGTALVEIRRNGKVKHKTISLAFAENCNPTSKVDFKLKILKKRNRARTRAIETRLNYANVDRIGQTESHLLNMTALKKSLA